MKNHVDKYSELRKKAQSILQKSGPAEAQYDPSDMKRLIEEFSINQIELELQNEELVKIRNQLESSQKYLENLFTHAPVGYIVLDSSGLIKDVNQTAARYFDIKHFALKGQRFKSFIPQNHILEFNECLTRLLEKNDPEQMEIQFRIKSGHRFWAKTDLYILKPPITEETCILCSLTDISKEKQSEENLKQLKESLEDTVRARTAELLDTNTKLHEQIKIREELDRRKAIIEAELLKAKHLESVGMLAGGIAHDFNNLLSVIVGNIELAKDYMHKADYIKHLEIAAEACFKGKELTSRLITFSRGGAPVKKIGVLSDVIRESCRFANAGSSVNCSCVIANDLWLTEFDEYQMKQALTNIIANAVESMPNGGVVSITAENVKIDGELLSGKQGGNFVEVTIKDHGIGIPEKNLPLIFDPYFSTKERGSEKGMGLGLSIAYSIISKHQGQITAESKQGIGTTICIRLPAYSESPPAPVPIMPLIDSKEVKKEPARSRKKILFMDDEEMVREFVQKLLSHLGYSVIAVKDGIEAIKEYQKSMASEDPVYAVILDLTIRGGMGGKETMSKIKEIDPKAIGIVSSGYFNDPVMENYSLYGFSGALPKPYQKKELMQLLEKI